MSTQTAERALTKNGALSYKDIVPHVLLTPEAVDLTRAESETPLQIERDTTLRVKVIDNCGHACVFCHNEGTQINLAQAKNRVTVFLDSNNAGFQADPIAPDTDLLAVVGKFQEQLGTNEIHLTGGEPTQHHQLPDIVQALTAQGLAVKMTSNGESGATPYAALARAGLKGVSFSIFGVTPREYLATQPAIFGEKWAARKITLAREARQAAIEQGIRAQANCVMSSEADAGRIKQLIQSAKAEGFQLRILNDLGGGMQSVAAIYNLLADLKAEPTRRRAVAGASGAVSYFSVDGQEIGYKQIRNTRLSPTCDGCALDEAGKCEEGFYGLRLYRHEGEYLVGSCIQQMDRLTQPVDTFFQSGLVQAILELQEDQIRQLEHS